MADVRLIDVSKTFDGLKNVVNGISVEIEDGAFLVIVGPSGCGKSTTLNMIAGLESVSSGQIIIGGKNVNNIEPKDRNIAMVFQNHALYPHLTVYNNLAFSLKVKHINKKSIREKVLRISEMLGLSDFLNRKPHQLSGGQKQRVAIGRAIIREPAVFLMDEPLSNLDANLRGSMREELKRLHQQLKTTFIYVTHDQIEAMTMATKLVVMNDGEIQQIGTPTNVFMKPQNVFVAKFMGSNMMNIIRCPVEHRHSEFVITILGIHLHCSLNSELKSIKKEVDVGVRPEGFEQVINNDGIELEIISSDVLGMETLYQCLPKNAPNSERVRVLLPTQSEEKPQRCLFVLPKIPLLTLFNTLTGDHINMCGTFRMEVSHEYETLSY